MIRKTFILISLLLSSSLHSQSRSEMMQTTEVPPISVTLGGAFIVTGTFQAFSTERADQFVTRIAEMATKGASAFANGNKAGRANTESMMDKNYALRNIKLKRISGEEVIIDLEKFRLTGDFKNNPYLKNDDVLIFPDYDVEKNFVSVTGAVNNPHKFQFVEGDRLSDAILFAHGLSKAYERVEYASISRLSYDGEEENVIKVKISEDPLLQMGDRVIVQAEETQKRDFRVYVSGEVLNPGAIPITKNSTTIYEVIKKMGGFKENADINRAELIRGGNALKTPLSSQEFDDMLMRRMANISDEDSASFVVDNTLRYFRGSSLVDFYKAMKDSAGEGSFIVRDGDYIVVPEKVNLVYVFGQVRNPGYVPFTADKDHSYYISKAGGISKTARGEIYLITGKSRTWTEISDGENIPIRPGDFIWVPKQPYRNFSYYLQRTTAIASVVGTVATIILLITQF